MAHVSHRLKSAFQGALAGGGDPATSPLYVFGPFLRLIVVAGVAPVTFGASVWLVVFTVAMVSGMYRLVMRWVVDGSGGSGLSEEEFGGWAVKINAGITFVEYTLTFLVSVAALVTFVADRYPLLNESVFGVQYRTVLAIAISIATGWIVNRGPKTAARTFGPATLGVLLLLWAMVVATLWRRGLDLPHIDPRAFGPDYLHYTVGGFVRILALMTGIEVFANLVAAYDGTNEQRSRKAFGSLVIIMGSTCVTMLVVGPAILALADPTDPHVSVFTQAMDRLLPAPLPYIGTLVGVLVLGSAAAASAQGLQNLALGLRYRHYIPASLGLRNRFDVADRPVWVEVAIVSVCYLLFGTHEETYLAIYAAGVFVLLSMTGWAAAKRLQREIRRTFSWSALATLAGTVVASALTTLATITIFEERFFEGAWTYFVFIPVLYAAFTHVRSRLGAPLALDDHLGRFYSGQYLLPYQRQARPEDDVAFEEIVVPLDGSAVAEHALPIAEVLAHTVKGRLALVSVARADTRNGGASGGVALPDAAAELERYLERTSWALGQRGVAARSALRLGSAAEEINAAIREAEADLVVMATKTKSGIEWLVAGSVTSEVVRAGECAVLLVRPTEHWSSRGSRFRRLLVSLDGSESAETALPYARALSRTFGSEIVLLSVPEAESEVPRLEGYLAEVARALRGLGIEATPKVSGSGAPRTIVDVAETETIDLIVMATRGRGWVSYREGVGSVAARVFESAPCPVLAVPVRPRVPRHAPRRHRPRGADRGETR